MDDRTVATVRRTLTLAFAAMAATLVVLVIVAVRGSGQSKAERLHSVRSTSLDTVSCEQWADLTADVQWISAYRELSTLRYEAATRNRQPAEGEVDTLVDGIASICAIPSPDGAQRTVEDAAVQAVADNPGLLSR